MMKRIGIIILLVCNVFVTPSSSAQTSVPYQWTEAILTAIRNDFARPPMTARTLFHFSMAMYDAWAAYDSVASTVFLGKTFNGFYCPYNGITQPIDVEAAQNKAISYAAYRIIRNRYINSPGWNTVTNNFINTLMGELGYDINFTSVDYATGDPAALGNYIAARIISYGNTDGSNQLSNYINQYYTPSNPPLFPTLPGTSGMADPNRWQPLSLSVFIDQNGNLLSGAPPFMGPEWGNVKPFALADSVKTVKQRGGYNWNVYHDPGLFPQLGETGYDMDDLYKWNFTLVAKWASHLDTADQVMWDISPGSIGNAVLPNTFMEDAQFYDFENGGDNGTGHSMNPITGLPYEPNMVRRGDYTRVLAEFWADGPNSETPPGHWYSILNYVIEELNGNFVWEGVDPMNEMEYCVKAYLTLGGAMHDAAISAWGIKGYYDGARPISAIRYMAEHGQSSDATLPNFNLHGIPLINGFTELVQPGDPLAGTNNENVNKVKMWTWKGPDYIADPATTAAGVGWILAENWYPYQRPTFVSPPFAGYVSGHSTYSRAGAEVLTSITGNEYFPGGMGVFDAPMNEYLVFEEGPSETVELQWATYRDAADQCSLSRIWGGIHPPMDDIPGRKIGGKVAAHAVMKADGYWQDNSPKIIALECAPFVNDQTVSSGYNIRVTYDRAMDTTLDPGLFFTSVDLSNTLEWNDQFWINDSIFIWNFVVTDNNEEISNIDLKIMSAVSVQGDAQRIFYKSDAFIVDTRNPVCTALTLDIQNINQSFVQNQNLNIACSFDEMMDVNQLPLFLGISNTLSNLSVGSANWVAADSLNVMMGLLDWNEVVTNDFLQLQSLTDVAGNGMVPFSSNIPISIDTQEPLLNWLSDSLLVVNESACGIPLSWKIGFNSDVSTSSIPQWSGLPNGMSLANYSFSHPDTLICIFNTVDLNEEFNGLLDIQLSGIVDEFGNALSNGSLNQVLKWDTKSPEINSISLFNVVNLEENSPVLIGESEVGSPGVFTFLHFSERMDTMQLPILTWEDPALVTDLTIHHSEWLSEDSLKVFWNVVDNDYNNFSVDFNISNYRDKVWNVADSVVSDYAQWVMMLLGPIQGCTDSTACNYLEFANVDDGSCLIEGATCDDGNVMTTNDVITADCQCQGIVISIEEETLNQWLIYPNPVMDVLYSNTTGVMECYNALGQKVWSGNISDNEPLYIDHWAPGLYWIRFGNQSRAVLKAE